MTERPTDRPTNRRTYGAITHREVTLPTIKIKKVKFLVAIKANLIKRKLGQTDRPTDRRAHR